MTPPETTLDALHRAGSAYKRAEATATARRQERDALIAQAAAEGHSSTLIAKVTGVTRQAVDQTLARQAKTKDVVK